MKFPALLAISLSAPLAAQAGGFPAPLADPVPLCRAPAAMVTRTLALPDRAPPCCTGAGEDGAGGCAGLLSTTRIAHAPRHVRT